MKKNLLNIALIIIAIVLGVCSWFLLPEVVAVQVGYDGQVTNTMPKLFAIVLPFGISVVGSIMNMTNKGEKNWKCLILSLAGIGVMIACLFFNR
ncbi:MAG: DUF1648 domain-containing protein [Lachnospiraceae bacterium]